jgi:hypothetical protein
LRKSSTFIAIALSLAVLSTPTSALFYHRITLGETPKTFDLAPEPGESGTSTSFSHWRKPTGSDRKLEFQKNQMNLRLYLRGSLWAGALLIVVLLVSGVLWLALAAAGDQTGSQGAKGVALVAIVCLVLDFATVIVLLALAEITRPGPPPIERQDSDPSRPS